MAVVNVNVTDPAFRQRVIFEAVNLWDVTITREHTEACERYIETKDPRVLDVGDPPPIQMMTALVNGYWYIDEGGVSNHPQAGTPFLSDGGTGWEYECFWIFADGPMEGRTLADLGDGARDLTEACHWYLDSWKERNR